MFFSEIGSLKELVLSPTLAETLSKYLPIICTAIKHLYFTYFKNHQWQAMLELLVMVVHIIFTVPIFFKLVQSFKHVIEQWTALNIPYRWMSFLVSLPTNLAWTQQQCRTLCNPHQQSCRILSHQMKGQSQAPYLLSPLLSLWVNGKYKGPTPVDPVLACSDTTYSSYSDSVLPSLTTVKYKADAWN